MDMQIVEIPTEDMEITTTEIAENDGTVRRDVHVKILKMPPIFGETKPEVD